MVRFAKLLLLLFTLSLISCGDSNLLMTLSDSESAVTFRTSINSGDILNPESGETIDISIEYDENIVRPVRLEIAFLDVQGLEISDPQIIEGEDLNEPLPSISVAAPDENLYSVRLRVFDNDDVLIKEEIISFFYSRESFLIRGIATFPNTFVPGGQGLILPDAEASDSSWVRWSIDNEIIEEGFLGQYRDGFIWQAPLLEGVYGLRMELFPVEPVYTANGTFPFTSPLRSDIEIFVIKTITSDPLDLYPAESYSTLIHFKGIIENQGTFQNEITPIGLPVISKIGDKMGFYLNKGSGYLIDGNILPVTDGVLMPFSVTFLYYLGEPQFNSSFLDITADGNELFSINTNVSGALEVEIFQSIGNISNFSNIMPEKYSEITLSVLPADNIISFHWYGDGMLLSSEVFDYKAELPDGDYRSVIGAENGFEGLLDEFGIYYLDEEGRNNIDDNIFARRVNRRYNPEKVIAAYGFDGLNFKNADNTPLSIIAGSINLDSDSVFQFLETDFNFSYLYIDIDFEEISDGAEIQISFPEKAAEKIIHINLEDLSGILDDNRNLEIELNIEDGILAVSHYGNIIAETVVQMHSPAVFTIVNNSKRRATKIASILVRREEKRVVEKTPGSLNIEL